MIEFVEIPVTKMSLAKRKLVCNIGINDANYLVIYKNADKQVMCPYYVKWLDMLKRCYSIKYHAKHPTYIGCTVHPDWHTFSNFKSWMESQDWQDKQLDKDILNKGNKVYSSETCIFIYSEINTLLCDAKAARGKYKIGVSWNISNKKFQAKCGIKGKNTSLGYFLTEEEASKAYLAFKKQRIIDIALKQNYILKEALLRIAETY